MCNLDMGLLVNKSLQYHRQNHSYSYISIFGENRKCIHFLYKKQNRGMIYVYNSKTLSFALGCMYPTNKVCTGSGTAQIVLDQNK